MPVADQGQAAIKALNGKEFYGSNIALSVAEEKQPLEVGQLKNSHQQRETYSGENDDKAQDNKWIKNKVR